MLTHNEHSHIKETAQKPNDEKMTMDIRERIYGMRMENK